MTSTTEYLFIKENINSARCKNLQSGEEVTLKSPDLWKFIPGIILTVSVAKEWVFRGFPYVSGRVLDSHFDINSLQIKPIPIKEHGLWDPKKDCWLTDDKIQECWEKDIILHGPRGQYELSEIKLKEEGIIDKHEDPILEAIALKNSEDMQEARDLLYNLLHLDIRHIDAHAHLGTFDFKHDTPQALLHYKIGVLIAEHSLGPNFKGVLPWSLINNRPYLRCLHGYGLCLLKDGINEEEAKEVFQKILWLNPMDNQGVRFLLQDLKQNIPYE